MSTGYIYILINNSYEGLIKIGITSRSVEERARELSKSTGVPTPFIIAYQVFSKNCIEVEKNMHARLHQFRVNPNREFFRYPLDKAIIILQDLTKEEIGIDDNATRYEAIDILGSLKEMYGNWLKPEISSARIYQTFDRVYFELTFDKFFSGYLKDQYIYRTDLGFIADDPCENDDQFFNPLDKVNINAKRFLGLDPYSLINCINDLFTEAACGLISSDHLKDS